MNVNQQYEEKCEALYRRWSKNELKAPGGFGFEENRDCAPEPYLTFGGASRNDAERKLVFVTTNPGGGLAIQTKEAIVRETSDVSYNEVQRSLVRRYTDPEFQRKTERKPGGKACLFSRRHDPDQTHG